MTPKEKAIELVKKYAFVEIAYYTSMHEVKDCALIAVDEIIDALENNAANSSSFIFYEEVKQEIKKL